ncbi:MAG TPA: type II toxin-antitoxin system VapC family toxin, partial [Acidisarcina sp.]
LSTTARKIIADPKNIILVSAASAWEISIKVKRGKLPLAEAFERDFIQTTEVAGYTLLPITVENALRAGRLAGAHRDPFDRLIAAQALADDVPIISLDLKLDAFGVRRIW